MNKFEQEVQSPTNDVVDSAKGFIFSFLFFFIIFGIGVGVNLISIL
ncbi:YqzM family protein [Pontibacillus litoralis]|uniref:Membrane protein n=1 Tax=Pontibacillus litoralis JSM 072002 TaxID=1385512 RepID=A0A0A5GCS6_9BACI|nr:YqzM family protein [Pontibacillus litoralis]KGX88935.1 membrane protein [Pontibacillus litoralis JSM 072002]